MQKPTVVGDTHKHIPSVRAACTIHTAHTNATLTHCFKMALLLSKIIAVSRSSHEGGVTDGDKLAGKKTAMHRYLKKRHANTSNSGRQAILFGRFTRKKNNTKQYLTETQQCGIHASAICLPYCHSLNRQGSATVCCIKECLMFFYSAREGSGALSHLLFLSLTPAQEFDLRVP